MTTTPAAPALVSRAGDAIHPALQREWSGSRDYPSPSPSPSPSPLCQPSSPLLNASFCHLYTPCHYNSNPSSTTIA
ncbi:MAG: hypothetical protein MJE68_25440 [Proteobacteria bacterium]|nr:hypothetical protein [Pseudomonadota bacterium]